MQLLWQQEGKREGKGKGCGCQCWAPSLCHGAGGCRDVVQRARAHSCFISRAGHHHATPSHLWVPSQQRQGVSKGKAEGFPLTFRAGDFSLVSITSTGRWAWSRRTPQVMCFDRDLGSSLLDKDKSILHQQMAFPPWEPKPHGQKLHPRLRLIGDLILIHWGQDFIL